MQVPIRQSLPLPNDCLQVSDEIQHIRISLSRLADQTLHKLRAKDDHKLEPLHMGYEDAPAGLINEDMSTSKRVSKALCLLRGLFLWTDTLLVERLYLLRHCRLTGTN